MNSQFLDENRYEKNIRLNIKDEEILEIGLRAALHRQDCPEVMMLSEYQLGLLSASDATQLAAHLDRCPYCREELGRLTEFLAEDISVPIPTSAADVSSWELGDGFEWQYIKDARRVIIRLVGEALENLISDWQQGLQSPADRLVFGGVRSDQPGQSFQMDLSEGVEDFEALITLETNWRDPDHCGITVEVNIPSRGGWPHLGGTAVTLKKEAATLATRSTNAFGHAVFEGVATADLTKLNFEITPQPNGD